MSKVTVDGWSIVVEAEPHQTRGGESVLVEMCVAPERSEIVAPCLCLTQDAARWLAYILLESADVAELMNNGSAWTEAWRQAEGRARARLSADGSVLRGVELAEET